MKKFMGIIFSIIFVFGNLSVSFANNELLEEQLDETKYNKELAQSMKEKFNIPDDYKLSYAYNDKYNYYDYFTIEKNVNRFEWILGEDEEDYDGYIYVSCYDDGKILRYSMDCKVCDKNNFAEAKSKEEQRNAANEFLKKMLPDNFQEFKIINETNKSPSYNYNTFEYMQYKNDVPVVSNKIEIDINKYNLECTAYDFDNVLFMDYDFISAENVIPQEDAEKIFIENIISKPYFAKDYYGEDGEEYSVYYDILMDSKAILAETGEVYDKNSIKKSNNKKEDKEKRIVLEYFTLAYNEEVERMFENNEDIPEGSLSMEEVKNQIESSIPKSFGLGEFDKFAYNKNSWNFAYSNGFAKKEEDGNEILIFNRAGLQKMDVSSELSQEINDIRKQKADEYIKEFNELNNEHFVFSDKGKASDFFGYTYQKERNGIVYDDSSIYISFDTDNNIGLIFIKAANDDKVYEPSILSAEEVFEKNKDKLNFGLMYYPIKTNDSIKMLLVYGSRNYNDNKGIIATTGEFKYIDYDDDEQEKEEINYLDIDGHWCEKYVKTLINNGIYLNREYFKPDEFITKNDFLEYVENCLGETDNYVFDDLADDDFITRSQLCEYIIHYYGYQNIIDFDIYKCDIKDVSDSGSLGKFALVNAMNIMTADDNGNFRPNDYVTNAEAAKIIYCICEVDYR